MTAGENSGEILVLNCISGGRSAPRESPSKGALLGSALFGSPAVELNGSASRLVYAVKKFEACLCGTASFTLNK